MDFNFNLNIDLGISLILSELKSMNKETPVFSYVIVILVFICFLFLLADIKHCLKNRNIKKVIRSIYNKQCK